MWAESRHGHEMAGERCRELDAVTPVGGHVAKRRRWCSALDLVDTGVQVTSVMQPDQRRGGARALWARPPSPESPQRAPRPASQRRVRLNSIPMIVDAPANPSPELNPNPNFHNPLEVS